MGTSLTGLTPAATYQGLIKFGNNSAIAATAQYLSDGLGNDLPISVSTTNVGIGSTSPYKSLSIRTSTSTEAIETRATTGNTGIRFSIADTSVTTDAYSKGAIYYLNTGASSAIGTMAFALNNVFSSANVSTADEKMRLTPNGSLLIGTTTESARLFVKGSGTTSATSSLLIQNSSLTELAKLTDDGVFKVGNLTMSGQTFAAALGDLQFNMLGGYSMRTLIAGSEYARLSYNGNFSFSNGTPFNATSKLQVRASGTTSATSCFLLENSSASQLIKVTDDGKMTIGTGTTGTAFLDVAVGGGSNPPLRLKGYSDAGTSYLLSAGTESFQDNFKIKMVNGNVSMGTQLNGYNFALETFNGTAMTIYNAGNIGIATTSIAASSLLQMDSTSKGFLPPRMTDAQIRAISTPSAGLMAYNTDLDCPCFYSTLGWRKISHAAM